MREKIAQDGKLVDYSLVVPRQKIAGRNPGWAKLYSTDPDTPGVVNLVWYKDSLMLVGRVVTRGGSRPDELIGAFVTYLMARHRRRIKLITVLPG